MLSSILNLSEKKYLIRLCHDDFSFLFEVPLIMSLRISFSFLRNDVTKEVLVWLETLKNIVTKNSKSLF